MTEITQELLKEHFEYREGHLWWIKPTATRARVGQQFGSYDKYGYRQGWFYRKKYLEHRLVWLYVYGVWPKKYIDHINGIRSDNRVENLRECSNQQNQFNRKSLPKSTSKYKGVSWYNSNQKWIAQYRFNGKRNYIGIFETEEEAAEAYRNATEHIHKEYANYG